MLLLLFAGAGFHAPAPPAEAPYQGDATIYDSAGATGMIGSGLVQSGELIYDDQGATGPISGGAIMAPETIR